jgi:hypothetical protein
LGSQRLPGEVTLLLPMSRPRVLFDRRSVRPVLLSLGCSALIVGAAFALEAVGLRRASREQVIAATAAGSLSRDAAFAGHLTIDDRPVSSLCLQGSFRPLGHGASPRRGVGIILGDRSRFVAFGSKILSLGRARSLTVAAEALRLGCPRMIATALLGHVIPWESIHLATTWVRGRPAYVLRFRDGHVRIEYVADRKTFRPLAVRLAGRRVEGSSQLEVRQLSVRQIRAFQRRLNG